MGREFRYTVKNIDQLSSKMKLVWRRMYQKWDDTPRAHDINIDDVWRVCRSFGSKGEQRHLTSFKKLYREEFPEFVELFSRALKMTPAEIQKSTNTTTQKEPSEHDSQEMAVPKDTMKLWGLVETHLLNQEIPIGTARSIARTIGTEHLFREIKSGPARNSLYVDKNQTYDRAIVLKVLKEVEKWQKKRPEKTKLRRGLIKATKTPADIRRVQKNRTKLRQQERWAKLNKSTYNTTV